MSVFGRCGCEGIKILATSHVHIKAKVKFSLCVPWRHMGECSCCITQSWPCHWVEVSGHICAPSVLPVWGNNPELQLNRRLAVSQSSSVHFGLEKNLLPMPRVPPWFPCCPTISLVTCTDCACLAPEMCRVIINTFVL
jgi:hypothetical protein